MHAIAARKPAHDSETETGQADIIQFSDARSEQERAEDEKRIAEITPTENLQTTLDVYHNDIGTMVAETKDRRQVQVAYVDTRAVLTAHESKIKDEEVAVAGIVQTHMQEGDTKTAHEVSTRQIEKTKQDTEPVDVFSRVMRRITIEFGHESIVRVNSVPDWRVSERNAAEIETAIATNMAFMIPEGLKARVLEIVREESNFGLTNSEERAIQNIITGNPREGENYIGIPVRTGEKNPVFMYFLYGRNREENQAEEREKGIQDGSIVDLASVRNDQK